MFKIFISFRLVVVILLLLTHQSTNLVSSLSFIRIRFNRRNFLTGKNVMSAINSWRRRITKMPLNKLVMDFGGSIPPPIVESFVDSMDEKRRKAMTMFMGGNITNSKFNAANQTSVLAPQLLPSNQYASFIQWWQKITAGRSGLLVFLIPGIITQLLVLERAIPFVIDRLMQYFQPLQVLMTAILFYQPVGAQLIQYSLWTSLAIGSFYMIFDTFSVGSQWARLLPSHDKYALITGASSGIGFELAKILYSKGFNIIIVSRDKQKLEAARNELRDNFESIHDSNRGPNMASEDIENFQSSNRKSSRDKAQFSLKTDRSYNRANPTGTHAPASFGELLQQKIKSTFPGILDPDRPRYLSMFSDDNYDHLDTESEDDYFEEGNAGNLVDSSYKDIIILAADLSQPQSSDTIINHLDQLGILNKIQVLVNNAGIGLRSPFIDASPQRLAEIIDVNMKASVMLTRDIAVHMKATSKGAARILFVSSTASYAAGQDVALYSATKAFTNSLAMSLRRELLKNNIFVTLACPGPVKTNFAERAEATDALVFAIPGLAMSVEKAASSIYNAMEKGQDLVIPGVFSKLYAHFVTKLLPYPMVASLVKVAWDPAPSWLIPRKKLDQTTNSARYDLDLGENDELDVAENPFLSNYLSPLETVNGNGNGKLLANIPGHLKKLQWKVRGLFKRFWYTPIREYGGIFKGILEKS